jgi:hypothetical protein
VHYRVKGNNSFKEGAPDMRTQSEKSPQLETPISITNPYVAASATKPPLTAADYAYRIAAVTAGIFFLATVV